MDIAINILGVLIIAFIVWWFWFSQPKALVAARNDVIDVLVDGGVYTPARIEIDRGRPITLRFTRKDPSPCAEQVVFGALGIARELALNKAEEIHLAPQPGEYSFTCQMGMYRGTLVVR